jgi:hypothetical protein
MTIIEAALVADWPVGSLCLSGRFGVAAAGRRGQSSWAVPSGDGWPISLRPESHRPEGRSRCQKTRCQPGADAKRLARVILAGSVDPTDLRNGKCRIALGVSDRRSFCRLSRAHRWITRRSD